MGEPAGKNAQNMAPGKDDTEAQPLSKTSTPQSLSESREPEMAASDDPPFYLQYSSVSPNQQLESGGHVQQTAQNPYNMPPHGHPSPYNMAPMGSALPDYNSPQPQPYPRQMQPPGPRQLAGASTPAVVYQIQQSLQYPSGAGYPPPGYGSYPQPQYGPGYGQPPGSPQAGFSHYPQGQHRQGVIQQAPHYVPNPGQFYYYPDAYGRPSGSPTSYSPQGAQFPAMMRGGGQPGMPEVSARRLSSGAMYGAQPTGEDSAARRQSESASNAIPRGPPRKPKQSGHALWVGNLPPGATIMALKEHFSREFTRDIESLFLISKSNCAFVNYRSEEACGRAMQKFHDSRFEGVRLVCRLRKGSAAASGAPTGPAAMTGLRSPQASSSRSPPEAEEPDPPEELENLQSSSVGDKAPETRQPERYFIVKSLTVHDLEQSVRNGIWATQSHNEEALNNAYNSADKVYLIFSANKSGEYFGYARMTSSIVENAAEILGPIPRTDTAETVDTPRTIPTPATEFAPRGHIIDDSARGTIFWEAELTDDEGEEETSDAGESETEPLTWGKPFKIEWMSTNRVPFYRTRGLRNPWNANREVKIARDGTELEPNVGKRLVELFHRTGPPNQ